MVAGSLGAHALVLFLLVLATPRPAFHTPPEPPPLVLRLVRPLPAATHAARTPAATRTAPAASSASATPQRAPETASAAAPAAAPTSVTAPSAPAIAAPSSGPAGGQGGAGVGPHGLLRGAVGCDMGYEGHQTEEQRAGCIRRFGEAAKLAEPFSGIPAEKRAYYDAIQKQYQLMHRADAPTLNRAPGALGMFDDPGTLIKGQMAGHMGGVGCGMKFGPGAGGKDKRSLSDRIKQDGAATVDIGPLKCGVVLPQGTLTPEIGVKAH